MFKSSESPKQPVYVKGTAIREVPESLGQLSSLESLVLSNNKLERLPESFNQLSSLEYLQLFENSLEGIPEYLRSLPSKLTSLNLSIDLRYCLKLDSNELSEIVKGGWMKQSFDGNIGIAKSMYFPGNEIPKWFRYQTFPASEYFEYQIPRKSRPSVFRKYKVFYDWKHKSQGNLDRRSLGTISYVGSDHVFLGSYLLGSEDLSKRDDEVSFDEVSFYILPFYGEDCEVKQCGIHFVYAQDSTESREEEEEEEEPHTKRLKCSSTPKQLYNDAILLVIIPAAQVPEIASSRALRVAKEYDGDGTRTVGVISKIDQASADQKALAVVQALLLNQGSPKTADIPWVALIGQSVSIATTQSGSEISLETAWTAESESLKSILIGAPQSQLGRIALADDLAQLIRKRMKVRVPNLLSGHVITNHRACTCLRCLQGKSQIVQDELVRLGEQMVQSVEGTRSLSLELCREFEDKFLQLITTGEGSGWKIVASFEGNFPNRIKQLPLDRRFDINNVQRIVLEADGYQPYLISPEKGLRSLIKVSAAANATPGLGRYPLFKREVVAIASAALDGFKNEARKMVVALVDMERAFVPPQHFIRLVQRGGILKMFGWMERQRREEEVKTRSSKKANEAEQAIMNWVRCPFPDVIGATSPQTGGFLLEKSAKTNGWSKRWFVLNEKTGKLGYSKKQEEKHFRGVIALEECNIEEIPEEEEPPAKSLKDKNANGPDSGKAPSLVFKITSKIPYKTVLKARGGLVGVAESGHTMRQSLSDGSLAVVLCQVEKAKEDMLNQLYSSVGLMAFLFLSYQLMIILFVVIVHGFNICAQSTARIEELLQEDQNVKRRRDRYQKQSELLSKLTRQLSIHDNRAAAASNWSDGGGGAESSPRTSAASGDDWRSAFDAAANGPVSLRSYSRSASNGHSRRYCDPAENGDVRSGSNSGSRRTPNRVPPPPPPTQSGSKYF
ncbi:Dynamin-2A [Citrus sinensis]|nr:Dynamin-2A [Citrus sinensis]